jgi:hypothetical protein
MGKVIVIFTYIIKHLTEYLAYSHFILKSVISVLQVILYQMIWIILTFNFICLFGLVYSAVSGFGYSHLSHT